LVHQNCVIREAIAGDTTDGLPVGKYHAEVHGSQKKSKMKKRIIVSYFLVVLRFSRNNVVLLDFDFFRFFLYIFGFVFVTLFSIKLFFVSERGE